MFSKYPLYWGEHRFYNPSFSIAYNAVFPFLQIISLGYNWQVPKDVIGFQSNPCILSYFNTRQDSIVCGQTSKNTITNISTISLILSIVILLILQCRQPIMVTLWYHEHVNIWLPSSLKEFVIIYLDIQPVYSSIYCSVIRNRGYFSMGMSLCNSFFGLPIW